MRSASDEQPILSATHCALSNLGELTLLTALASQLANELLRFETQELLDQSRSMQQRLRRYVPGAISQQLEAGDELAEGEREVTVLFVDVRGYTAIAQGLQPSEIFSTVNRYTEAVSQIVQRHGGTIVEFNGDGMMTVFGAPFAMEQMETAAVAAAREIATGPAYVGNVRSVDRFIWTAIGNTTNPAARLQSLSRDLDTAIVLDGTTRSRCARGLRVRGARPDDDPRPQRPRRGVHALALTRSSSAPR